MMVKASVVLVFLAAISGIRGGVYTDRFQQLYNQIVSSSSGYYSKDGVPYHCAESMMVISFDYGHETVSEAISYNIWLQAMHGEISGDFGPFNEAWNVIEDYLIPQMQNNTNTYNSSAPSHTADITTGADPINAELKSSYGDSNLRLMHWLLDVDNVFGFGNIQGQCELGPTASGPSFINLGPGSVWQGITHPACDSFKYGGSNGFSWYSTVPNWQYTAAPDADARAILGAFWASKWAKEKGKSSQITGSLSKAAKLGDYLRYSFFDENFKKIGNCIGGTICPAGKGKESAHYLISWYVGWGGSVESKGGYSWRKGSGKAHIGYQNPITAYALINDTNLRPSSASAVEDWTNSLQRQIEFYNWTQTSEGALGGGVTNSWNNTYDDPPAKVKTNTFHGMWYQSQPGYDGSSNWFGMQSWTADRLAQYYYLTGDATAKSVLAKWTSWVLKHINVTSTSYSVPEALSWTGSTPSDASATVVSTGNTIGLASSIARTLTYYAAKSGDTKSKSVAKQLLDAIWATTKDSIGLSVTSTVTSLSQVTTKVYIPVSGWTGTYPNGDKINSSSTFLDIRSWYKKDANWNQLQSYLNGGPAPKINYHRFWEQADAALAFGAYGLLFQE